MILPFLAIASAVVVAAVPWGLPGETTFILPFMTLLLIFLFSVRPGPNVPVWFVFLSGLAADILTAGPLGYWALLFTLCHSMSRILYRKIGPGSYFGLCLAFAITAAAVAVTGWAVASLYYLRIIDWWPIALGLACSAALCPLSTWAMRRILAIGRYQESTARG